jgi:hypothetical protein
MTRRLNLSLESIKFQHNPAFFKELTLAFSELKKKKANNLREDAEASGHISKIIKNHTRLKVAFDISDFGPMVEVPHLNKNHPLVHDVHRDWISSADGLRLIAEAGGVVHGSVNLVTGKVSGVFEDMDNRLYYPADMISGARYTPEELAAVCLHEIGHLMTYCEYMTRTVTTNQVLAGLSMGLGKAGTPEEREAILVGTKKALHLDIDTGELAKEKNNEVVTYVVISNVAKTTADEIGFNIYDLNTWEALSDAYAARQGAGAALVTALDKIYRLHGNISFRSTAGYLGMEGLKFSLVIGGMMLKIFSGPLWGLAIAGHLAYSFGVGLIIMDGMGDGTYDRPGMRLLRVRNQIVEEMKNKKISADQGQRLSEDLLAIDEVLKSVNDREQLWGKLYNLFSSDARKRLNQEQLTRELETIATNDLFAASLSLRQQARQAAA